MNVPGRKPEKQEKSESAKQLEKRLEQKEQEERKLLKQLEQLDEQKEKLLKQYYGVQQEIYDLDAEMLNE